ncbi:MAG: DUF952 domain-containing protein [Cyanobacteria bacterium J06621_8]
MSNRVWHITTLAEWQAAQAAGFYQSANFTQEGFIHCSYSHQLLTVANRFFHGQDGLVVLLIDSTKIERMLVNENLEGGVELFPHLYGVLPNNAVSKAITLSCNPDGSFNLPQELQI